jgi:uncharacterized protein (UPF0332 family)
MTDIDILKSYRLQQAEETLRDAVAMLDGNLSPRSIVNRSYYAIFYAVLALFLSEGISVRTSKHSGVISTFDKSFILSGKMDRRFSKILHRLFNARQEGDYKELVVVTLDEASDYVDQATEINSPQFYCLIKPSSFD